MADLKEVPWICQWNKRMKYSLVKKLKPETKIRFQYLYKEGEPSDKVYLVK